MAGPLFLAQLPDGTSAWSAQTSGAIAAGAPAARILRFGFVNWVSESPAGFVGGEIVLGQPVPGAPWQFVPWPAVP